MNQKQTTSSAVDILHRRHYDGRPERQEDLEAARESMSIARVTRERRTAAGLTQKQLAEEIGTTASVISRIENEGHGNHSVRTLRRIAVALGVSLRVEFGEQHTPARGSDEPQPGP